MKHTREHHKQWKAHIKEWHSSGKSQKAFCRENGLSYWQFRYYLQNTEFYRPRKAAYKQSYNQGEFIRVEKEAIPAGHSAGFLKEWLSDYNRVIVTDGWSSYDKLTEVLDLPHAGCWAHASALFYSLVESAKVNKLNPYDYLTFLFENFNEYLRTGRLSEILPNRITQQNLDSFFAEYGQV